MKNLIPAITISALAMFFTANAEARDCKRYTYENTQSERQALHHKGLKSNAERLVRQIEACQVQLNGGMKVKDTQDLHYRNDVEIRNYSIASQGRY